eukprot:m.339208 g.339208  ORF g.339208 m.339208 type:complete len:493 (+) comp20578_c0_seq4:89-1567(+)
MPVVKAFVKWGKERFEVDVNSDESPDVLKAQLFALTQVVPERQKIMLKGKAINDTWPKVPFKDKMTFLLMGSIGAVVNASSEKVTFMEDLKDTEMIGASNLPPGLPNHGNTCYLNAAVQCMARVPELSKALKVYSMTSAAPAADTGNALVKSTSNVMEQLDSAKDSTLLQHAILDMVMKLRAVNPQFAEMGQGGYSQQDADEAWGQLMTTLRSSLPSATGAATHGNSFIDQLFGIKFKVTLTCNDNPEEPKDVKNEDGLQLQCPITKDIGYLMAGLKHGLSGTITKNSPSLDRDALYTKTSTIDRLPGYVCVKFLRFYFKERDQVQCKVGKNVKFPLNLDLIDLVTPELSEKLRPARNAFEARRSEEIEAEVLQKKGDAKGTEAAVEYEPYSFPDDPDSNNSGYYELVAVLTHKGRSSSSGHYVGWGKTASGQWACFDDDTVTAVKEEEVLKLSGEAGADWHNAYMLVYASKKLPKKSAAAVPMEVDGTEAS